MAEYPQGVPAGFLGKFWWLNLKPSTVIGSEEYDLVVIGGGITGAGVARDAALRGLDVALFEKDDFAQGTSSRSTKLVHGGLRYLENYDFRLVREALRERETLLNIASHLVYKSKFFFPVYEETRVSPLILRAGLTFYGLLAWGRGIGKHQFIGPENPSVKGRSRSGPRFITPLRAR